MDIVRIILSGYGYEVSRGIITKEEYKKIEKSNSLDNIWVKGLYKYLGKKWERISIQEDYGITSGDILVTVNDETVIDVPISVLDSVQFSDGVIIENEGCDYPKTKDIVMTTLQGHYGIISDIMFMTDSDFDISKLKFIRKNIHNEDNDVIVESLISAVYYDDEPVNFGGSETDLRMSNIYFDNKKEDEKE